MKSNSKLVTNLMVCFLENGVVTSKSTREVTSFNVLTIENGVEFVFGCVLVLFFFQLFCFPRKVKYHK